MNLWRLELLRLARTHRWAALLGVYVFFGAVGPLTARYVEELVRRFGGGVEIAVPDPRPADGIAQFVNNAGQLGLLTLVVVGAGAIAFDARPELAAFLRTRVPRARRLLLPRYAVTTGAAVAALVAGTAVAWAMTASLIGPPPARALLAGTAYGALYLAFVVAVVAAVAGFARTQVACVFATLAVLLVLPALSLLSAIEPWLPSRLLVAVAAMADGAPARDFARAAGTTAVAAPLLLALAAYRFERREL